MAEGQGPSKRGFLARLPGPVALLVEAVKDWWDDKAPRLSAALAAPRETAGKPSRDVEEREERVFPPGRPRSA